MQTIDLTPLKNIQLQTEPAFFPPAIGWWLILITVFIFIVGSVIWFYLYYTSPKQYSLRLLKNLYEQSLTPIEFGIEISKLLKRVALFAFPKEDIASLSGKDWKLFLMTHAPGSLNAQQAEFISEVAYLPVQKAVAINQDTLYTAVKEWIYRVLTKG